MTKHRTDYFIRRGAATRQSQSYEWEIASRSLPHSALALSAVERARNSIHLLEVVSKRENGWVPVDDPTGGLYPAEAVKSAGYDGNGVLLGI